MSTTITTPQAALTRSAAGRPAAPVRIVHLGLGAFHRAHQAWYTDVADTERQWGIAAFTGRSPKAAAELRPQGGVYTLIERAESGDSASIIGSISEVADGADVDRLIELISLPTTAIITITITEAGYRLRGDGMPDLDDEIVAADIAHLRAGTAPASALARIIAGLRERNRTNGGPLAIVPCDNMPENGQLTRTAILTLAGSVDLDLASWIEQNVAFVSTSIDRITPKTTEGDLGTAAELTGWNDAAPVVTEPFRDWVLSGDFPAGRPAWEIAGARFVEEIAPYENRKLWLLNGSHTLLAYAGSLAGYETIAQSIADPRLRAWVNEFWDEAVAHLPEGLDLDAYREALLARFDNARIAHRLAQIGQDGVTKLRVRILPTLLAEREAGRSGAASIRAIASWAAVMLARTDLPDAHRAQIETALHGEAPDARLLEIIDPWLVEDAELLAEIRATIAALN